MLFFLLRHLDGRRRCPRPEQHNVLRKDSLPHCDIVFRTKYPTEVDCAQRFQTRSQYRDRLNRRGAGAVPQGSVRRSESFRVFGWCRSFRRCRWSLLDSVGSQSVVWMQGHVPLTILRLHQLLRRALACSRKLFSVDRLHTAGRQCSYDGLHYNAERDGHGSEQNVVSECYGMISDSDRQKQIGVVESLGYREGGRGLRVIQLSNIMGKVASG